MAVLITGSAGFVGSHSALLFRAAGIQVVGVDNLSKGNARQPGLGPFFKLDIADVSEIRKILRRERVSLVLHLAGSTEVAESMARPDRYFANNVQNGLRLLEAMLAENVRRIVFASSCSIYGNAESSAASETAGVKPMSPYGESKLFMERVLRWYGESHGMQWIALRYFNVAGVASAANLGEDPETTARVIPRAVNAALGLGGPFRIMGTRRSTPDGTAVRDYVHVSDVADANLRALRWLERGGPSGVLNIGTGRGVSIRQVLNEVARAAGQPVPAIEVDSPVGDPAQIVADVRRAEQMLGWKPVQSDLRNIVESVLSWYRNYYVGALQGEMLSR
jgi:UDP-glucose-4-epimerase GalE